MRVVNIVTQREAGGAQVVALTLAEELRKRGHVVETWFLYPKTAAFSEDQFTRDIAPARPTTPASIFSLLRSVRTQLRSFRADAVISHTYYSNLIGQLAALLAGVRVRVAVHHNLLTRYPRGASALERVVPSGGLYTHSVAVSDYVRHSFPPRAAEKISVIHNGVRFNTAKDRQGDARRELGLPSLVPLVATVGRLEPIKNHELLVDVLAAAPALHAAIAGTGPLREHLQHRATARGVGTRLHLLGECSKSQVALLLRAADLFVLPSVSESFGLVAIEAALSGTPIVCRDLPSLREILLADGADFVASDDPAEWARRIADLLASPDRRRSLAACASARAACFTASQMADSYETLLSER